MTFLFYLNRRAEHKDREAIKQFWKFWKNLELIIINENSQFQDKEQQKKIKCKCIIENIGGYGIRWKFLIRRKEW